MSFRRSLTTCSAIAAVWSTTTYAQELEQVDVFRDAVVATSDHISLEDTNDTYLGNMQKDGTYSVIPRIAGGEITPEKLIVLGQVAKDYTFNAYFHRIRN